MDTYSLLTNGLVFLLIAVLIRHSLYRLRYFLHIFQLVGYKTNEFRHWLFGNLFYKVITPEHVFYNILIFVVAYFFVERLTMTAGAVVMSLFAFFWFVDVSRFREEKEKKPLVFTSRMKRLAAVILLVLIVVWYSLLEIGYLSFMIRDFAAPFIRTDPYFMSFSLIFVDILIPVFVFAGGWLLKPVEWYIQNGFKKDARKKLASLPNLSIVAITGSYGKTSTKFIVEAFLKERMKVLATPGSYNTPMGICKVINNDLEASHQVLILEMGARYEGNIGELCDITEPDISIVTNVGLAHLETFGSKEAIAREKSTLVSRLKTGGVAVLNGDDERVRRMGELRKDMEVVYTGTMGSVTAGNIEVDAGGTSFTMTWLDGNGEVTESETIRTKFLGEHNIQNILLGAAVAREFQIRLKTIAIAASKIEPVEHRLELKKQNGFTVIDDAFNSNPVGAENAIKVLESFKAGKKIIITPGMIELGEMEDELNYNFGTQIARAGIDVAILVGKNQTKAIQQGIDVENTDKRTDVRIVESLFEANDLLQKIGEKGDVVLYENDLPDSYNR